MSKLIFSDHVKTFFHDFFGKLTVIKSDKEEDKFWFIGKEIQNVLGFKELRGAIRAAELEKDEFSLIVNNKKNIEHKKMFDDFVCFFENEATDLKSAASGTPIISKKSPNLTLISESGVYGLAIVSRKSNGKEFRRILRREIMPKVRKTFADEEKEFFIKKMKEAFYEIQEHYYVEHQKLESKKINYLNLKTKGYNGMIVYNRDNCFNHSNWYPSQLKKMARECGYPVSQTTSGLEVLRIVAPEIAAAISFTNSMVFSGADYNRALALSKKTGIEIFKGMLDLGVKPKELSK